jgi:poly(3-hydroxybutyrate) depolymerase
MLGSQGKTLGPSTDVIDANTQIWQFVSRYHGNFIRPLPD